MNCQFNHHRGQSPDESLRGVGFCAIAAWVWRRCRWRRLLGGTTGAIGAETGDVQKLDPLAPKAPHFKAKAKRVIYLFMAGAPSHLELFDYKPQLAKFDGTTPPPELLKDYRAAFIDPKSKLLGPQIPICQAWPMRRGDFGIAAAPGGGDRRGDDRQIDDDRRVQSCTGADSS